MPCIKGFVLQSNVWLFLVPRDIVDTICIYGTRLFYLGVPLLGHAVMSPVSGFNWFLFIESSSVIFEHSLLMNIFPRA